MPLQAVELRNLAPGERAIERWDSGVGGVPGLVFHLAPTGRRTWFLVYQIDRRRRRFRIGEFPDLSLAKARQRARDLRAAIARGSDPQHEVRAQRRARAQAVTVAKVVDRYLRHLERKGKKSRADDRHYLGRALLASHAETLVGEIDRADLVLVIEEYADRAPIAANRCLASLKTFFRWAKREGYVNDDPTDTIDRPAPERVRRRVLSLDEVAQVWHALEATPMPEVMQLAVRFMLLTGVRRGEALGAMWSEVDWRTGIWCVPASRMKAGREFVVPLSTAALAVLRRAKEVSPDVPGFVFASPATGLQMHRDSLGQALGRSYQALGVARFSLHDLRRTVGTQLRALGVSRDVVAAVLAHRGSDVTSRHYSHFDFLEERRQALEVWGETVQNGRTDASDQASRI